MDKFSSQWLRAICSPCTGDDKSIEWRGSSAQSVDQAGSERTEAGESALPAEESPQPGRAKRRLWEILQEDIIDFIMGAGGETSLNLPCFLILAPHLSCHLAFPLLFVGAAGDEGDPV